MGSTQRAVTFFINLARAAFGIGAAAVFADSALYTVDGGQRAVLFDRFRGVIDNTAGEGTHFLIPWLQKPYIFDIHILFNLWHKRPAISSERFLEFGYNDRIDYFVFGLPDFRVDRPTFCSDHHHPPCGAVEI